MQASRVTRSVVQKKESSRAIGFNRKASAANGQGPSERARTRCHAAWLAKERLCAANPQFMVLRRRPRYLSFGVLSLSFHSKIRKIFFVD
jgi:hypothetical protein